MVGLTVGAVAHERADSDQSQRGNRRSLRPSLLVGQGSRSWLLEVDEIFRCDVDSLEDTNTLP